MSLLDIRKIVVQLEEVQKEMGREVSPPSRKVTVAAVIKNPYAGQYVEDLEPLYDLGAKIGGLLAERGMMQFDRIYFFGDSITLGANDTS